MLAQPGENKNDYSSQIECQELQIDLNEAQVENVEFDCFADKNEISQLRPAEAKKLDFLGDQPPVDEEIDLSSSLEILSKWSES